MINKEILRPIFLNEFGNREIDFFVFPSIKELLTLHNDKYTLLFE